MKRRILFLISAVFLILAGRIFWWAFPKRILAIAPAASVPAPRVSSAVDPQYSEPTSDDIIPPPRITDREELRRWWISMIKRDKIFEWKMPIRFYGKVIDDHNQAVEGAGAYFEWTNLSKTGSGEQLAISDAQGLFQLTGVIGKCLSVRVKKDGFSAYNENPHSFEYAAYFEESFHLPDSSIPVIFKLRRNREAEPLLVRENQEARLVPGQKNSFLIGPGGAVVVVERLPNTAEGARGWSARVSAPGGGLQISIDEFPFEAPEEGYSTVIEVMEKTPKPLVWQGDNGAAFFVKTPQGYGRITVRNTPGTSWVYVSSYFNPKVDSRILEFDQTKTINH